jgi:hypothetical protein
MASMMASSTNTAQESATIAFVRPDQPKTGFEGNTIKKPISVTIMERIVSTFDKRLRFHSSTVDLKTNSYLDAYQRFASSSGMTIDGTPEGSGSPLEVTTEGRSDMTQDHLL